MNRELTGTELEPARPGGDLDGGIAAELAALGFDDALEVGRGGFGTVYRCTQVSLSRIVAVKVVTVERHADRARFVREQQAMATLTGHPNIVVVLQVGQTAAGDPFLVMPYCALGCWQDRIASVGMLGVDEVSRVGVKIAGALECGHRAGVIHRDVKPSNILCTDYGEPALSDFGTRAHGRGVQNRPGRIPWLAGFYRP